MTRTLLRLVLPLVSVATACEAPNVLADLDLPSPAARWEAIEARVADRGPFYEHGLSSTLEYDPSPDNRWRALNASLELPVRSPSFVLAWGDDDPSFAVRELTRTANLHLSGSEDGLTELVRWLLTCAYTSAWTRATRCREIIDTLATQPRAVLELVTSIRLESPDQRRVLLLLIDLLDELVLREPSLIDHPALIAWLDAHAAMHDKACATGPVNDRRPL